MILNTVQQILEECCFDFFKQWLPSVLLERGWDCAAAAELTNWTRVLDQASGKLPKHALKITGASFGDIIMSTNEIRHTAVHRVSTTFLGVDSLVESARKLTETLQDTMRTAQLSELRSELASKIEDMELYKNVLENSLRNKLQEIKVKRNELDVKEKQIIAETLQDDLENKSLIGVLLEISVRKILNEKAGKQVDIKNYNGEYNTEEN